VRWRILQSITSLKVLFPRDFHNVGYMEPCEAIKLPVYCSAEAYPSVDVIYLLEAPLPAIIDEAVGDILLSMSSSAN
jgi:hypothetical protein